MMASNSHRKSILWPFAVPFGILYNVENKDIRSEQSVVFTPYDF